MTPRQAYTLASVLDIWAYYLDDSLRDPSTPLHEISPFDLLDLRVMMLVQDNRAWATATQRRCHTIADDLSRGVLPFDRPAPFIDAVLIGAALVEAQSALAELSALVPNILEQIPPSEGFDDQEQGDYLIGDDDWDIVSDGFDDLSQWDSWEIPLYDGHPLLPPLLAARHPFTWFDCVMGADFATQVPAE